MLLSSSDFMIDAKVGFSKKLLLKKLSLKSLSSKKLLLKKLAAKMLSFQGLLSRENKVFVRPFSSNEKPPKSALSSNKQCFFYKDWQSKC